MRQALHTETLKRVYGSVARRYDLQHALLTFGSDAKGRKILVENAVREGDEVLDCGCGTGTTGILAAKKAGPKGRVTFFDLSDGMVDIARGKVAQEGLQQRARFRTGDMVHLPFPDDCFDVVLSTYSLCPLYDPARGALELYRVTRAGGVIGIGHSTEPGHRVLKRIGGWIEDLAWRFPGLSMGCRAVNVLPALEEAGGRVLLRKRIGVPLWPFLVFVIEKPADMMSL